jgi:hypothetical protein
MVVWCVPRIPRLIQKTRLVCRGKIKCLGNFIICVLIIERAVSWQEPPPWPSRLHLRRNKNSFMTEPTKHPIKAAVYIRKSNSPAPS